MTPTLLPLLEILHAPQAWLFSLSPHVAMVAIGLMIASALGLAGFVLARLGYRPLWAVLLLVPTLGLMALWVLAFKKFPRETSPTANR